MQDIILDSDNQYHWSSRMETYTPYTPSLRYHSCQKPQGILKSRKSRKSSPLTQTTNKPISWAALVKFKTVNWAATVVFNEDKKRVHPFPSMSREKIFRVQRCDFVEACTSGFLREALDGLPKVVLEKFKKRQPKLCRRALSSVITTSQSSFRDISSNSLVNMNPSPSLNEESKCLPSPPNNELCKTDNPRIQLEYLMRLMTGLSEALDDTIVCKTCICCHHLDVKTFQENISRRIDEEEWAKPKACKSDIILSRSYKDGEYFTTSLLPTPFRFLQLQLAMKNQRVNRNSHRRRFLMKPFTKVSFWQHESGRYMFKPLPFFTGERLLLRIEHWVSILNDLDAIDAIPPAFDKIAYECSNLTILCSHLLEENSMQYYCKMGKGRCTKCALEFQYADLALDDTDAAVLGNKEFFGTAYILTVWRDLGRCESLSDPRLRAHFYELDSKEHFEEPVEKGKNPWWNLEDCASGGDWDVGTLRNTFEQEEYDITNDWKYRDQSRVQEEMDRLFGIED